MMSIAGTAFAAGLGQLFDSLKKPPATAPAPQPPVAPQPAPQPPKSPVKK